MLGHVCPNVVLNNLAQIPSLPIDNNFTTTVFENTAFDFAA